MQQARKFNWPELLHNYLHSKANAVYQWGILDCSLFVADWILILTDIDYAESFRGKYDSQESAIALMGEWKDENATDPHYGAIAKYLDSLFPTLNILKVSRGDIVINSEGSVGICNGAYSYFMSEKGLANVKTSSSIRGWSV
jgi:hypothetical protein